MATAASTLSTAAALPFLAKSAGGRCTRRRIRCSVASDRAVAGGQAEAVAGGRLTAECVVVGGGISGLCTAQALATRHGQGEVLVTEARDRVGGNITTVERDGYLWEEGPNSFQPSDPVLSMAVDSGLKDDLVFGDPNAPRFVLWNGKLRPVPSKPTDLPLFDLMSFAGKLRAGLGAIGIRPPPPGHEESVEDFVRRNLGDEVFERLIEPFCSGVYAGDPAKLSMKAAFGKVWRLEQNGGSIIGGTIKAVQEKSKSPKPPRDPRLPKPKGQTVASFSKGLAMLPNAIFSRLGSKVKLSWKLISIKKLDSQGYMLTYETPEGLIAVQTRSVVLTIPSYIASSLLHPISSDAADALSKFYYPPVAAVSISYSKEVIRKECLIDGELKGFGQLHPRSQGLETLGTIYSSSLFPNRAPPGRVLLLNYIGGATNTGILSKGDHISCFLKLRRWWKGVDIFQKAYIFLPVHGDLHWSLVIICIPSKEDESGLIILHLDSLGIHPSGQIFDTIGSYLKEEWNYVNQNAPPPDHAISDRIWRHLPCRIQKERVKVPQQKNEYDCGLFVLYFMERFIREAPERLRKEDLDRFDRKWFKPEEASGLRKRVQKLLLEEFESARLEDGKESSTSSASSESDSN